MGEWLVRPKQQLQAPPPLEGKVSPSGEQGILLDETTSRPRQTRVLALPHGVQGILQMSQHVELVVDDSGLRSVSLLERGRSNRDAVPRRWP